MFKGVKFQWCGVCKNYTASHNTATHNCEKAKKSGKKPKDEKSSNFTPTAGFGLVPDLTAWVAEAPMCVPCDSIPGDSEDDFNSSVDTISNQSQKPTWNSTLGDLWSLMKPHISCGSMIGATHGICCLIISMLTCHTWMTLITIGDVLQNFQLIPAPVLCTSCGGKHPRTQTD